MARRELRPSIEGPGVVDLTELFDFPTISTLAQRLEAKLAERE